jgi:hypothetical protein
MERRLREKLETTMEEMQHGLTERKEHPGTYIYTETNRRKRTY